MNYILDYSFISKIISSLLNTLIEKSSEPAMSSGYPSSSQSKNSKAVALSPVTVQNFSSAFRSTPVIEQLPPATTIGVPIDGKVPNVKQFTPSDISLSNKSQLSSTSKKDMKTSNITIS